jgi:thiol-disulfide isomerase/thioredoxin
LDSFATYVSETEAVSLLQNANQLTGNWIGDGKQVSELVESFVSVRGQLINLLARTKTDTAQEILDDTNELLDKCVAGDSSMEKVVPRLRKSLDQYQAKIRIEKRLQAMIGVPAHEFDVIDWVNEKPQTMSQYRGKVVLLDFWAVWCAPCLQTLPELKRWDETYGKDGLQVLGVTNKYNYRWDEKGNKPIKVNDGTIVSTEDEIGMLKRFLTQRSIGYPILLTPKGGNMQTDYNVGSIPHMVLIDRLGIIRLVNVGVSKQGLEAVETRIQELLEEPNRPN